MFNGHYSLSFKLAGFILVQNGILAALLFYLAKDMTAFEMLGIIAVLIGLTLVTLLFARHAASSLQRIAGMVADIAAGRPAEAAKETKRRDEIGTIARHLEEISRHHLARLLEDDEMRHTQARQAEEEGAAVEAANAEVTALKTVIEALDGGVRRLAVGDLTARLDMPFPDELEGLRADFNHALATLEETLDQIGGGAHALHADCAETRTTMEAAAQASALQTAALATTVTEVNTLADMLRTRRMQAGHTANVAHNASIDISRPKDEIHAASTALKTIRETCREIEPVATMIRELAFEANMLAMNTGIEAAHADGPEGRFKASAEEIRGLAERAAEAAGQISGLSRRTAESAELGTRSIDRASGEIEAMAIYIEALRGHVEGIATGSSREIESVAGIKAMVMALSNASRDHLGTLDILTARIGAIGEEIGAIDHRASRFTPVTILKEGGVSIPESMKTRNVKPQKRGSHLRLVKS